MVALALGPLAFVRDPPRGAGETDLGDHSHVDGVIEPTVAAPGQPVDLLLPGGHLDPRGPVVGGERGPAGETVQVDHRAGHERPDPVPLGHGGPQRVHGQVHVLLCLPPLLIDALQVTQQLPRRRNQLPAEIRRAALGAIGRVLRGCSGH